MAYINEAFQFSATGHLVVARAEHSWITASMPQPNNHPEIAQILGDYNAALFSGLSFKNLKDATATAHEADIMRRNILDGTYRVDLGGHDLAPGTDHITVRNFMMDIFDVRLTAEEQAKLIEMKSLLEYTDLTQSGILQLIDKTVVTPFDEPAYRTVNGQKPEILTARYTVMTDDLCAYFDKTATEPAPFARPFAKQLEDEVTYSTLAEAAREAVFFGNEGDTHIDDGDVTGKNIRYIRAYTV